MTNTPVIPLGPDAFPWQVQTMASFAGAVVVCAIGKSMKHGVSRMKSSLRQTCQHMALVAALLTSFHAQAHTPDTSLSAASALSALPMAVSVAAPAMVLSGGVVLTVAAVKVAADATQWVLVRASDGARVVLRVSGHAAGIASVTLGTVVTVTALSAGHVLSVTGEAVAFVPNELGKALLYSERVSD